MKLPSEAVNNLPAREVAAPTVTAPARGARAWRHLGEFALGTGSTNLWPRWLFLRAFGVVFVTVFAGIVDEGRAILGPTGLAPATSLFQGLADTPALTAFLRVPSLFWLSPIAAMITSLSWLGVAAAVALVLNLWPRVALGVCWVVLLSFVTAWGEFTPAQLDGLMLETALLCIPFAPAGRRPGLGANSPPSPLAMFMIRWLVFRIMFEAGIVKLISVDSHWRNLTAMDVMYETSPSPTILGYWVHHLPHGYHVFEIAFTFVVELIGPLLAVFGGRRGRWWAFLFWTIFQTVILLTCNFGWLNVAALGVGLLLLDDSMLAQAATRLRWRWLSGLAAPVPASTVPAGGRMARYGLRAAFGLHFSVTVYYFIVLCGVSETAIWVPIVKAVKAVEPFQSANGYYLYAKLHPAHYMVDFEGSNDGGRTWRTYPYRHLAQAVDRAPRFTAPWFPRFENTIFFESGKEGKTSVIPATALKLLLRHPDVMERFAADPFPDRPPTVIRMRRYRLSFTDLATHRRTGHYWRKEYAGEYVPGLCLLPNGKVAQFDLSDATAALSAGNYPAARSILELQYQYGNLEAGYQLADLYARGVAGTPEPGKIFALFSELASRGEIRARHNVGLCHEFGVGVPADPNKAAAAYRLAAEDGHVLAMLKLGDLSARNLISPRDDVEGLSWLLTAATRSVGEDPGHRVVREQQPALAKTLTARMSPAQIAAARSLAAGRK